VRPRLPRPSQGAALLAFATLVATVMGACVMRESALLVAISTLVSCGLIAVALIRTGSHLDTREASTEPDPARDEERDGMRRRGRRPDLIEYALLAAFITCMCIATLGFLGGVIPMLFDECHGLFSHRPKYLPSDSVVAAFRCKSF